MKVIVAIESLIDWIFWTRLFAKINSLETPTTMQDRLLEERLSFALSASIQSSTECSDALSLYRSRRQLLITALKHRFPIYYRAARTRDVDVYHAMLEAGTSVADDVNTESRNLLESDSSPEKRFSILQKFVRDCELQRLNVRKRHAMREWPRSNKT